MGIRQTNGAVERNDNENNKILWEKWLTQNRQLQISLNGPFSFEYLDVSLVRILDDR